MHINMLTFRGRRVAAVLTAAIALVLLAVTAGSAAPNRAAADELVIWADKDRKPAVERVAGQWGSARGVEIRVVEKEFGQIRNDLGTVKAESAPDVIVGAHDWTGELAASGLLLPLNPSKATRAQIPGYALDSFSYGTAVKKLYGAPVAIENIGLFVNTALAPVPRTWAALERSALAVKRRTKAPVGIAVQQGAGGDAYHMYPFFSGLCGYIFGKNKAGNLDPSDIGLSSRRFLANAPLIDKWNRQRLVSSKVDDSAAKDLFTKKKVAFWLTGPWNVDTAKKAAGKRLRIVQVPKIRCRSAPFLGVQGFMVTKYASAHNLESAAKDLVGDFMLRTAAQSTLASANNRFPANTQAGKQVRDTYLAALGRASAGGVPMPNIPQMASVWSELGGAWVKSTKGSGATKASRSFRVAARNIANKIG
ncbi:MAG: extracellular solute-binding protein [Thermoleophilia bacterium]|nr:extracellular solute-binding protein [Thermoleophilia bacterium]